MILRTLLILLFSCSMLWLDGSIHAQDASPDIEAVNFYYPKNAYKFKLSSDIKSYIKDLKSYMQENDSYMVKLDGFSYDGSNEEWNTRVSKYRVRAVRDLLIDYGIAKNRIEIEYFGKTKPIAENDSSKELAKNRRVELRLVEQG